MEKKTERFDMRMTRTDMRLLKRLARRAGVSKSKYLTDYIRRDAKLKGILK